MKRNLQILALIFSLFVNAVPLADARTPTGPIGRSAVSPAFTFENFDNIVIPAAGSASVYPSVIDIGGVTGTITGVKVTLFNVSHSNFGHIDAMLVAPGGTNVTFLSDVDSTPAAVSNLELKFEDGADNRIGLFSSPASGAFKPSAYFDPGEGSDVFAAPAPTPSGATELNNFNGLNPNGVWRLYVTDDTAVGGGSIASGWRLEITTAPANRASKVLDFDGDGRTDVVVLRTAGVNLDWHIRRSTLGDIVVRWGLNGDTPVPADYNGDGITDVAVWGTRPGAEPQGFYFIRGIAFLPPGGDVTIPWGTAGDDPRQVQDFDGDGIADPTVVRNEGGSAFWYIRQTGSGGEARVERFGGNSFGDIPIRGDYDGDGKADLAVYRTAGGTPNTYFILQSSSRSTRVERFGVFSSDFILPGDFDGDGVNDLAVWRGLISGGDGGRWYWKSSRTRTVESLPFGISGPVSPPDFPAPGDHDGDGRTDPTVWRRTPREYHISGSTAGHSMFVFGLSTDRLVSFEFQAR